MPLTPKSLWEEWRKGAWRPAYCLLGEDESAKLQALKALKALPDLELQEFELQSQADAEACVAACRSRPLFVSRTVAVVRSLKGPQTGKPLLEYLANPAPGATLVLLSEEKRLGSDALSATMGALGGAVLFSGLAKPEAIRRLVQEAHGKGLELEEAAAEWIVEEAGAQWGTLRTELDKLLLLCRGKKRAGLAEAQAGLGYRQEANPFDFPKALQARQAGRAIALLGRLLEEGQDPFQLLYAATQTVLKQLKAKRLLRAGAPEERIFRELRLHAYYDKDFLAQAGRRREEELIAGLSACLETEIALKSKSWLSPVLELERLALRLCR